MMKWQISQFAFGQIERSDISQIELIVFRSNRFNSLQMNDSQIENKIDRRILYQNDDFFKLMIHIQSHHFRCELKYENNETKL